MNHNSICVSSTDSSETANSYKIEGQIILVPEDDALKDIRILVNEGEYIGFPRVDGTFAISGVPSGSYIVSISSPRHAFEPIRVDINTKGKIRAREVNRIRPSEIVLVKYPLRFDTYTAPQYFEKREVTRWTDIIFNPMFSTIIAAIIGIVLLPKLISPQEDMQAMFEQTGNVFPTNANFPDLTDLFIRLFGAPKRQRHTDEQKSKDNEVTSSITRQQNQNKKKKKMRKLE